MEEPTEDAVHADAARHRAASLEKHHNVRILDEGVAAAVRLSHRYLPDRQLPDKAVSVLDTACARLALGQNATPPAIEDAHARSSTTWRCRSACSNAKPPPAPTTPSGWPQIAKQKADAEGAARRAQERVRERSATWSTKIRELRAEARRSRRHAAQDAAAALRDANSTQAQRRTGRAAGRDAADARVRRRADRGRSDLRLDRHSRRQDAEGRDQTVLKLEKHLGERVIGQDHALGSRSASASARRAPAWKIPASRSACSCWSGPSGVGKTETALALADLLYGGERNLITINMSEFQEAHTVSTLKGSPPGYVGYGEGGVLTEAVRRRPYSVVLLDEVEKAHPDVLELFFQVFDKGMMEDGEGREIDFKNTIIILTSNAGTDTHHEADAPIPRPCPAPEGLVKALKPELDKIFKPAFLGRMVIIPYYPGPRRGAEADRPAEARQDPAAAAGEPPDRADLRRRAGRRGGQPLHGSRERRAQRRQHPDQHAAAGDLAAAADADGRGREDDHASRRRRTRTDRSSTHRGGDSEACHARADRCVGVTGSTGLLPDVSARAFGLSGARHRHRPDFSDRADHSRESAR